MSVVLTVEIQGDSHEDVQEKLQGVSNMLAEDFHAHDPKHSEDGSVRFLLTETALVGTSHPSGEPTA